MWRENNFSTKNNNSKTKTSLHFHLKKEPKIPNFQNKASFHATGKSGAFKCGLGRVHAALKVSGPKALQLGPLSLVQDPREMRTPSYVLDGGERRSGFGCEPLPENNFNKVSPSARRANFCL